MQTFPLTDGSRMALVVGQIRTPCGRVIQREYRSESRRAYYRDAGEAVDNTNRPSCKTDHGRVIFGGGGIVPDVTLPRADLPGWIAQADERGLLLSWASGFVAKSANAFSSIETIAKPGAVDGAAVADFRAYATANGVTIPPGPTHDDLAARALARMIAFVKFGQPGYYKVLALTDPAVKTSLESFARAAEILGTPK